LLYILWGEDTFSCEEKLQEIKNGLGDLSLLTTNTSVLDGQKLPLKEFKAIGEATPFLAPQRLIIVRGLLERFETKERAAKPKKNPVNRQDEALKITGIILGFPQSTLLILIDNIASTGSPLKNNPLYQALAKNATVIQYPKLSSTKLDQWIQGRITRQGSSISRKATGVLIDLIGGDLYTLANEINKLAAYAAGRMIEEKDVRTVVSAAQETTIFNMIDFIMEHNSAMGEMTLQRLLQNGVVPPLILVMLARQIQILVQIKDLKRLKKSAFEIQSRLGIHNPYAWTTQSYRAEKYSMDQLKEIYRKLVAADLSIKTGKLEGDLALNILIAELCQPKSPVKRV
jgi:DNA polymerase III subunit delta